MKITFQLFEAFLKCPTKCWLRASGQPGAGNTYAEWVQSQADTYHTTQTQRLLAGTPSSECVTSRTAAEMKTGKWRLGFDIIVPTKETDAAANAGPLQPPAPSGVEVRNPETPIPTGSEDTPSLKWSIETHLHAVERVPTEGRGKSAQFIPIRFIYTNKLGKNDKLLLAFDAYALTSELGRDVRLGKFIHGDDHSTLKVKTSPLAGTVRKYLEKMAVLLANPEPPDLVLNRHCAECEFQARCHKIAVEKDDLSLLANMNAKERQRLRNKGIFTVTQLSYTFRPRRTPKRAKNPAKPRYLALQALAIREKTVYLHGTPTLPQAKTHVYLDIEGLPDRNSYYLIGALVVTDGEEFYFSFWADSQSDEPGIFTQFTDTIFQYENFHVFHFGDYDTLALKRMRSLMPESYQRKLDIIIGNSTNILAAIYPHVYFPTFSNSLKDIGPFLGIAAATHGITGLQSIIWRATWLRTGNCQLKTNLADYNHADCITLKRITDFIVRQTAACPLNEENATQVIRTEELKVRRPHWQIFRSREYALDEFKTVVKCAYFEHQRERVFVRTDRKMRTVNKRHRKLKRTSIHPNSVIELKAKCCPRCGSRRIELRRNQSRILFDLRFTKNGVKKWVIRKDFSWYYCFKCHDQFNSWDGAPCPSQYGRGLLSWCVYMNVVGGMNMGRVRKALGDLFGLFIPPADVFRFKRTVKTIYQSLYEEILRSLLSGQIIHIDETAVNLRGATGYVWVIASMEMVYYFYRPSREGEFLGKMLQQFKGVLISDFFSAYDMLPCEQQKCLAHLVRELDDDVFHNPLNEELKDLARDFGRLLKGIVGTVDRFGLKRRHLNKYKKDAHRFLRSVGDRTFTSDVSIKYQKRFEKSGVKMFTFLEHDGVPWNNVNAEHAIKAVAKYRRDADGRYTESTLTDYLIMASVFETCEFNNVNVLQFLLSNDNTLDGLLRMAGRKIEPVVILPNA